MIRNKNIAMIGAYPPTHSGGIASHVYNLSKESSKHNLVTVITSGKDKNYWREGQVQVYQEKLLYPYRYSTLQTIVQTTNRAYLLRKKVDLYHAHGPVFSGIGFLDKKKPLVLTIHGYPSLEAISTGRIKPDSAQFKFMRWVERKAVERADAIIAVDSTIKNFIIKTLDSAPVKVFCIPNGVDIAEFSPAVNSSEIRRKYIKDHAKLVVCIRRFAPKNGVNIVLDAINILINKINERNIILILGGGGSLEGDFKKFVLENGLQEYVAILGSISHGDMPKYFSAADLIINTFTHIPYVDEQEVSSMQAALDGGYPIGTSITTIEALASGRATIVCTVGGKYKKLNPLDPGILLPDDDPETLAEVISEMIANDELRNKIGSNGRNYVVSNRSWDIITKKVEEVYAFALEGAL